MLNRYRHFYLYAKGHYKKNDVMADLKKIASNYTAIDVEFISSNDIIRILTTEIWRLMDERLFSELISDISPDNIWKTNKFAQNETNGESDSYNYVHAILSKYLSILSFVTVFETIAGIETTVLELGEPDENILPLNPRRLTFH